MTNKSWRARAWAWRGSWGDEGRLLTDVCSGCNSEFDGSQQPFSALIPHWTPPLLFKLLFRWFLVRQAGRQAPSLGLYGEQLLYNMLITCWLFQTEPFPERWRFHLQGRLKGWLTVFTPSVDSGTNGSGIASTATSGFIKAPLSACFIDVTVATNWCLQYSHVSKNHPDTRQSDSSCLLHYVAALKHVNIFSPTALRMTGATQRKPGTVL